jgi:hypothetical protein
MKVHTSHQEQVLERLLAYAGSSRILESAMQQIQQTHGTDATLDELLSKIDEIRTPRKVESAT